MEGGRLMWVRNSIQSATEQAARYAMVNPTATATQIKAVANNYYTGVGVGSPIFTATPETVSGVNFVSIEGSLAYETMLGWIDLGVLTLHGKARAPLG
ncbi:MAG: hypothetical protein EXQ99_01630 [Alphaproteobacteria bacterium]|nr:hypothetical protein [Alphaproteobacteria bacterium]